MVIAFDPCTIGMTPSVEGMIVQVHDIEGLDGVKVMIPLNDETLAQMHSMIGEHLGKNIDVGKIEVADLATARQEAARHARP